MTVQQLITVLQTLPQNKSVDVWDSERGRWMPLEAVDVGGSDIRLAHRVYVDNNETKRREAWSGIYHGFGRADQI